MEMVISQTDVQQFGCPWCGFRSGAMTISCAGAGSWSCGECRKSCLVLADSLTKVPKEWTDLQGQPVQPHPRHGIPAHGRLDLRPDGGVGEHFHPRGIGSDHTPGCFVCGGINGLYSNISAFVQTKESGERVVSMFTSGAWLDYRAYEPDYLQVKIGACASHLKNLEMLYKQTSVDGIITLEKVRQCVILGFDK